MDSKAQVSIEYLLTLVFAVMLVIAATIIAFNISSIVTVVQTEIIAYRETAISSLMG